MNNTLEDVDMGKIGDCYSCLGCSLNDKTSNQRECVKLLSAEVQRLRDEREANPCVWDGSPSWYGFCRVAWDISEKEDGGTKYVEYTRFVTKTRAQEIAEERTNALIKLYPQYEPCKDELIKVFSEFEERTKKEGGK